jgi:hypothetical protein
VVVADVSSDHLVDLVDLEGANQQRFAAFDVGGEASGVRTAGEILDPAARIDQNQ